jgi:membrane associated rhomboid family serine protease
LGVAIVVPLNDENPIRITPYVTYGLIFLNVLVFLFELSLSPQALDALFYTAAVVPVELTQSLGGQAVPGGFPEWTTLVTSQFLHGGWLHLGGNMLYLWVFGNNLEEQMGRLRYLVFYILCGVLAGLTQWFFAQNSSIPSLGASGAIAGVLGAYVIRFPKARILTLISFFAFRVPAYLFLGFWFVQQAFYSVASLNVPTNIGMESGGVAYWAHAGGFVFGAILGPLFGLFSLDTQKY